MYDDLDLPSSRCTIFHSCTDKKIEKYDAFEGNAKRCTKEICTGRCTFTAKRCHADKNHIRKRCHADHDVAVDAFEDGPPTPCLPWCGGAGAMYCFFFFSARAPLQRILYSRCTKRCLYSHALSLFMYQYKRCKAADIHIPAIP